MTRRRVTRGVARAAGVLLVLLTLGCASSGTPVVAGAGTAALEISPEAERRAARLLEQAGRIEPRLTALLEAGAERLDVHLYGLENRVKSRESLERKIQTRMLEEGLAADEVEIDDVVRYTVLLDDEPPGDFNDTTADILQRADSRGHEILRVKNYWPSGDTYSGVNCVVRSPEGFHWELQFHTIGSLAAKNEGHALYEELRLPTTTLTRQREIFDRLAERWSWVRIPAGVLTERSLHPREEIILHDRP